MKKNKILVCGVTGFIGSNLAYSLLQDDGNEVFGTYFKTSPWQAPGVKMIKADLTNKDDVDLAIKGMDIIIQTAAVTSGAKDIINEPYRHVTDNAIINSLIFRSAFEHKVSKVVFFSCSVMYQSSDTPVKETDFDANKEIFENYFGAGWTKVYNEKMCEFYSRIGKAKYTVIRHSNIYGPHDKYDLEKSHVFGATITKVMTAPENGKIVVWGSGEEERDLLYVSDLVNFVEYAVGKQETKFEIFNVGYGSSIAVKDLVAKVIKISEKSLNIEYDLTKPSIKTIVCLDCSKAKKRLGWEPRVSIDDGIKRTIDWYRANITSGGG